MEEYYVLLPAAVTSVLIYAGVRRGAGQRATLGGAVLRMVELVGLAVLVSAANLAAGFVLVLALRKITGTFVSLYMNTDGTLIVLSLLQAVVLQWWLGDGE